MMIKKSEGRQFTTCGGQNNALTQRYLIPTLRTGKYGKKDFADVIMLRISRRESIIDNPGEPTVIISVLIKQTEEGQS